MRAVMKGRTEIVRHLLDSNAILSSQLNENKESALTLGCGSYFRPSYSHGANIEQLDKQDYTPLMKAAKTGKREMVAALLAAGTRHYLYGVPL
ncbi:Ankyrin repeat and KH domain-containing protein [Echinococcus granulosus]|uniref:Ankyrin repeat and KH domain-containing protein n=1 Tax=Echinococcus granulosus TaxID=6210 RepID=W6U6W8_ECHGR|nr:Ankyrin repeat and KH domain-containing protein [Echinococcus granulosus]EUB54122.1 Ankyrin repeat and KH domain-containing protein [Echinococcus granulosus]